MDAEDTITALGSLGATVLSSKRDISPFGEVYKPIFNSPEPGPQKSKNEDGIQLYMYMYVQKKVRRKGIGFHQHKGNFIKQFSSPTMKMIVWNNGKVCCPSLPTARWIRWEKREVKWISVVTKEAPTPEEIVLLVFLRSTSQYYTCQLFLSQMRKIFTLS